MRDSSAVEDGHQLKRHFGTLNLISIGIGAIIGAWIFVDTRQAAALFAGLAIVLSFMVSALIYVLVGALFNRTRFLGSCIRVGNTFIRMSP